MFYRYGLISALCPLWFAGIVLYLQRVQPSYDWQTQFMSELALGSYGFMMYTAFGALAIGVASLIPCFRSRYYNPPFLRLLFNYLLGISAVSFVLAGIVTLALAPTLHIVSVFIAFMALATVVFIVFRQKVFGVFRWFSLGALLLTLISLFFGNIGVLEPGTTQRMTALGILGWMSISGLYFALTTVPSR
jgi:hypothetical protein